MVLHSSVITPVLIESDMIIFGSNCWFYITGNWETIQYHKGCGI